MAINFADRSIQIHLHTESQKFSLDFSILRLKRIKVHLRFSLTLLHNYRKHLGRKIPFAIRLILIIFAIKMPIKLFKKRRVSRPALEVFAVKSYFLLIIEKCLLCGKKY